MTTATATAPAPLIAPGAPQANLPAPAGPPGLPPIWPSNVNIDVLGVTGEYASGKSLFCVTIDPPRTLVYDFEKSLGTYESLGFTRIDVPTVMQRLHPNGYKTLDVFRWWLAEIKKIDSGRFSVIAADPISDIEQGLADYVLTRHQDYGFRSADAFEKTGGIFWSAVKAFWKQVLADLASRSQTFAFTTHTKAVWRAGAPTRERNWKGKDTLAELASLFLWLDRDAPKEGKDAGKVPDKPAAKVIKSRLASARFDAATGDVQVVPCLPPRLPIATPHAIRQYILNPPDYAKLKKEERVIEAHLSEDERQLLALEIAQAQKATKELDIDALNRRAEMQETARRLEEMRQQQPDQTAAVRQHQDQRRAEQVQQAQPSIVSAAAAPPSPPVKPPSSNGHAGQPPQPTATNVNALPPGNRQPGILDESLAGAQLGAQQAPRESQASAQPLAPGDGDHPMNNKPGFATRNQVARIMQLANAINMPAEMFKQSMIASTHDKSPYPSELKQEQAERAIAILAEMLAKKGK